MSPPQAFADESFHEDIFGGFYVLAAAVLPVARHAELREVMLDVRGSRRSSKLHWYPMDHQEKLEVAKRIADFDELHVVTVGTPVRPKRQERSRAMCLQRLVVELHGVGVDTLVAEARQADLNKRDIDSVRHAGCTCPSGRLFASNTASARMSRCCGSPTSWPGRSGPGSPATTLSFSR
ncbi:hypothetical protein [Amycolatopsis orientalis]|uniref:hypothetical protein n=1 Tax=Amycolatopsis orientalis TaxID=31958 RepID=UPI000417BFC2|nr:hypothetical protein [Amycolatopsis orientalis]